MSYFVCLAIPQSAAYQLAFVFDKRIYQMEASHLPIGRATQGKNRSWKATLLQIGSSSASLIGKGGVRRTHNNDHTACFISGIQALLESEHCSSVSFLVHWMKGIITTEAIQLQGEKHCEISALAQVIFELEEDVRYVIAPLS